jgi:hypothetical protein
MSGLAKAFVVINLILALFFLGASATLFKANKNWKQVAEKGHQELGELKERADAKAKADAGRIASLEENGSVQEAEIAVLTTQKQELENANGALNTDKSQLQARVNTLEAQIAQKDSHLQDRDNTLAAKDEEIARLVAEKTEADESRKVAVDLSQRARLDLQQQEEANEHLLTELTDIRKALDEKTLRLEALATIGYPVDTIPVAVPKISGIVSAVRGDIVVLSVGRQDNVREGYEFTIYEGDRFIGKVKVESLLDDMSGARVLFTEQGATIKAGQNASTRLAG